MITAQTICLTALESIIAVFFFSRLLDRKLSFILTSAAMAAAETVAILLTDSPISQIICAGVTLTFTAAAFCGGLREKARAFLFYALAWFVSAAGSQGAARLIFGGGRLSGSKMIFIDLLLLSALAALLTAKHSDGLRGQPRLLLMMLLFTAAHLGFLVTFFLTCKTSQSSTNVLLQLCFQLILIILMTVQYSNSMRISELERREAEVRLIDAELENNRRIFMLADSRFSEVSRIRHDIQNHISTARLLMQSDGDGASAKEMISAIEQRLDNI